MFSVFCVSNVLQLYSVQLAESYLLTVVRDQSQIM